MSENVYKHSVEDYDATAAGITFQVDINGGIYAVEMLPVDLPEDDFPLYVFLDAAGDVAAIEFSSGLKVEV